MGFWSGFAFGTVAVMIIGVIIAIAIFIRLEER